MRRAYQGSGEEWDRLLRYRRLDIPSAHLQKYYLCFRETDEAVNDEFLLESTRRSNLIAKIKEAGAE
jgi:hypothetical protein